jgi:hypothetical protein
MSQLNKLISENMRLLTLLDEAYELSTWAACINFDGSKNEISWCKALYEKIENFQEHYEKHGLVIPKGSIPIQESK